MKNLLGLICVLVVGLLTACSSDVERDDLNDLTYVINGIPIVYSDHELLVWDTYSEGKLYIVDIPNTLSLPSTFEELWRYQLDITIDQINRSSFPFTGVATTLEQHYVTEDVLKGVVVNKFNKLLLLHPNDFYGTYYVSAGEDGIFDNVSVGDYIELKHGSIFESGGGTTTAEELIYQSKYYVPESVKAVLGDTASFVRPMRTESSVSFLYFNNNELSSLDNYILLKDGVLITFEEWVIQAFETDELDFESIEYILIELPGMSNEILDHIEHLHVELA